MIQMSKDELIELAKPRVSIPLWYDSNFDIASNSSDDVSVSIPLWYDSNLLKSNKGNHTGFKSQFHYGMIQIDDDMDMLEQYSTGLNSTMV